MLRFIRSYYLYIYYWFSVLGNPRYSEEKPFKARGFLHVALLIVTIQILIVITILAGVSPEIAAFFSKLQSVQITESYRGTITGAVVAAILLSVLVTYVICCVGIKFDDIHERLKTHNVWLSKWSFSRVALLLVLDVMLVFVSLFIFH